MIHFFTEFSSIFGAMLESNWAMLEPCWGYVGVKLNIFGIFGYPFTIFFNMCSTCSNLEPNWTQLGLNLDWFWAVFGSPRTAFGGPSAHSWGSSLALPSFLNEPRVAEGKGGGRR